MEYTFLLPILPVLLLIWWVMITDRREIKQLKDEVLRLKLKLSKEQLYDLLK